MIGIVNAVRFLGRLGRKVAPTACAVGGAIGVVATGYSAAKAGKEVGAYEAVNGPMPVKKKIRTYAKPAILGATSIALIFTGDRIHAHRYAALGAAANLIQNNYDSYREAAKSVCGNGEKWDDSLIREKKNEVESNAIWELCKKNGIKPIDTHTGTELWYEPISQTWFLSSEDHVKDVFYHINRNFQLKSEITFNEYLRFLGLPSDSPGFELIHWDHYEGETIYGYEWIDFNIQDDLKLRDGTPYKGIFYPFEPHLSEK